MSTQQTNKRQIANDFVTGETKHALANKKSHSNKSATTVLDVIMTTHANGDLCAKMLCNATNRSHLEKVQSYHSHNAGNDKTILHIKKDEQCTRVFPPLGDNIRDTVDEAASNNNNPWGISDHDRHTQEIQGVGCEVSCAVDHKHEVTKNHCRKQQIGADALWDVGNDTGQIACAVLVPSTGTTDLSHAAMQVSKRKNFEPKALHSDTWPAKLEHGALLFGDELEGRLGLFHFMQRTTRTFRKKHVDHFQALNGLLKCVHEHNTKDHEDLLRALKEGTLNGKKHSNECWPIRSLHSVPVPH